MTTLTISKILVGKGVKMTGYSEATNQYVYEVTPEALVKIQAMYPKLAKGA